MALTRRFCNGLVTATLFSLPGAASLTAAHAADAVPAAAPAVSEPALFSASFSSEFGFTLGDPLDPKRNRYLAANSQDNSNLYFVVKLAKPYGPFEQVVVGMSPKSQRVVNMRARHEFSDAAACMAELQRLNDAMQSRLGVKSARTRATPAWVFYNVEQAPVAREMSCNDKRMDFYVFDKKLIFQGVTESLEANTQR